MSLKYVIVEDEPLAAERLQHLIEGQRPHWQLQAVIPSVRQAVQQLLTVQCDVIFLDVHLSDGNSFSIFEQIQPSSPVIFTTAYDQYALKAFELNSIDYLLKPVAERDLTRALQKLEQRQGITEEQPDWNKLLQDLKPNYKDRFMVSTGERLKSLSVDDICFFFAQGKHTFITDKGGRQYIVDQTISRLSEVLNPKKFFQINRQYIICFECIEEMIPYSKSRLKLHTKPATPTEAIVSVDKAPKFKSWLEGE